MTTTDETPPEDGDEGDDGADVRSALSTLKRAHAPPTFTEDVTGTIRKRSAGRFFGKKTFGDRVPFALIVAVAVIALGVIAYILWASQTGSLKGNQPVREREHRSLIKP